MNALNARSPWFLQTKEYILMGSFHEFDIWYRLLRYWSVFSSILTHVSDCIFSWWWSAASWAHLSRLTCCPICHVASCLLVLPYSHFTRQWASSPCSRWASVLGSSAEEQRSYKLCWEGISTPKSLYSVHVVAKKMEFCGWQIQSP